MKKLILFLLLLSIPAATYSITPAHAYRATALFSTTMALVYAGTWYWSSHCTKQIKEEKQKNDTLATNSATIKWLKKKKQWINSTNTVSLVLATATAAPIVMLELLKKRMNEITLF